MAGGLAVVLVDVVDGVGRGDGPFGRGAGEQSEFHAGLDGPFPEHAEVPAGAAGDDDTGDEVADVPAAGLLPAGLAGLGDFDDGVSDGELISDGDIDLRGSFDGQVFAERTIAERGNSEFGLPEGVVGGGVGEDGLVGASVIFAIGLAIAFEAEGGQAQRAIDRLLESGRDPEAGGQGGIGNLLRLADLDGGNSHGRI